MPGLNRDNQFIRIVYFTPKTSYPRFLCVPAPSYILRTIATAHREDDQYLLRQILRELAVENPIHFFANGQQLLDYLSGTTEQPFVILPRRRTGDINMTIMGGLELRQRIEAHDGLRKKAIPFIFLTTDASPGLVQETYGGTIQGFFKKATSYSGLLEQIEWIVGYWRHCVHPHNLT